MLGNDKWPAIVAALLHGNMCEQLAARETLWREGIDFVVRRARLPIGRLGDDDEVRRDIAVDLLEQMEKRDYQLVREWERRQLCRRNAASWWTFVSMLLKHRSIDQARTSKLRTVPRSQGFKFAIVEPVAPIVFAEALPSMHFLAHCSGPVLADFLERLNATRATVREAAPEPVPKPSPTTTGPGLRRGRQRR